MAENQRAFDHREVTTRIEHLELRIRDRFPQAQLRVTCAELLEIARSIDEDLRRIRAPHWPSRLAVAGFIAVAAMALIYSISTMKFEMGGGGFTELVQVSEAGLNEVFLIGAAFVFMLTLESRTRRGRIIAAVNRLRRIAHIVDMHQLTKDPTATALAGSVSGTGATEHSPERKPMTPYELARYLDYCSEMLSLSSKVAFAYIQDFQDPEAQEAVNDFEALTADMSRKIWQKIMLVRT